MIQLAVLMDFLVLLVQVGSLRSLAKLTVEELWIEKVLLGRVAGKCWLGKLPDVQRFDKEEVTVGLQINQ